jgi:hypothetical protein
MAILRTDQLPVVLVVTVVVATPTPLETADGWKDRTDSP